MVPAEDTYAYDDSPSHDGANSSRCTLAGVCCCLLVVGVIVAVLAATGNLKSSGGSGGGELVLVSKGISAPVRPSLATVRPSLAPVRPSWALSGLVGPCQA